MGIDFAGYNPGQGQDMGSMTWAGGVTDDDIDDMMMADADMGGVRTGLIGGRVFNQDDPIGYAPPASNAITGLLGDYGTMATEEFDSPTAGTNFMGPLTDPSYGDVTSQIDTFRGVPMSQPGTDFFGGDVTAPTAPVPIRPAWSPPSMTPTAPATPVLDDFSGMKQAQMKASTAAAQQRYLASLDDESARRMNQMSQAQIANEMANQAAIRSGQGLLTADVAGDEFGYSESGMGQQAGRGHPGMR